MIKVSVVIPTYNLQSYIEKTLDSVLNQTVKPYEIIVVDDGSTDNTVDKLIKYPVKVIKQENAGAAAARNRGVVEARGNWIAFLDGDDEWLPEKIKLLIEMITEEPELVMVAHNEYEGYSDGPWLEKNLSECLNKDEPLFDQLFRRCFLSTSTMSVRRKVFLDEEGMDTSLRSCQDYDLWLRLSLVGKLRFIPETLSRYVLRDGSITANAMRRYYCLLIIIAKHEHRVKRKTYLYRMVVVHYEALRGAIDNRQYIVCLKIVTLLPFKLLQTVKSWTVI
jgi:glycosyltransferase involved in cell wall biosynthesis